MTKRIPVGVFFALFTISGFAGLIYQSIWSHYLKLFLGHAAYAQTLVLAIFMGGMAIGSWLVARYTHRIRNLLVGYALAELGIGLLAIVFHRVFVGATAWAFDTVLPMLGGHGTDLFKWVLGSLLILPASILLGTTFPLMSGGVIRLHPQASGRALAMLYFTNSFGAAIGVLASGFWLIDRFGLPGTVLTAGIMNVVLALVVWVLTRRLAVPPAAPGAVGDEAPLEAAVPAATLVRAILLLAFATGAASFVYEVTWIRMLTLGLGASTHSFEVMLAAFIIAMSLGALWARDRIRRMRNDTAWLAGLLVAKAVFAMYAVWIYGDVLGFMGWMMHAVARTDGGYVVDTLAGLAASLAVMFPAAFCAGITLPLATHALTARGHGEASIGRVYAANTAGCIAGAVLATHVGMELLGVKGLTGAGALLEVAVAVLVYAVGRRGLRAVFLAPALAAGGLAVVLAFYFAPLDLLRMASGVYRQGIFFDPAASRMVFYRDGKTATISVVDAGAARSIRTNGKADASLVRDANVRASPDEATMTLAAALPLSAKPDARLIANIGFGSGLTTHSLLGSPRVERVDTIEIERMMVEGARSFLPRNARAYEDPRSHIYIEDAKTFFASEGRRYDVITSEPSNPWVSGVSTLFSREFYHQVRRYLKDDGVLVQWIQSYEIDLGLLSTVFNALGAEFGDYTVYRTGVDLLIVATPAAKLPPLTGDVFQFPGLGADLRRLGFEQLGDLRALRVGGRAALEPLFGLTGFPANSDYFPILDQRAPRARFRDQDFVELPLVRNDLAPVLALLDGEYRTPVDRLRSAGVNRPERVDEALAGAEMIGVALTGDSSRSRVLRPAARASALLVHSLLGDCRESGPDWVDAVTQVAARAIPFLDAADVKPFFDEINASRCARGLDDVSRHRIALLEAVNARDAGAIWSEATYLLEHGGEALRADRAYFLASAIAAGLAQGKVRESVELRERYLKQVPPPGSESLPLRLALSNLVAAGYRRP